MLPKLPCPLELLLAMLFSTLYCGMDKKNEYKKINDKKTKWQKKNFLKEFQNDSFYK